MPRYRVTIVQIYEVILSEGGVGGDLNDVHDSLMDNLLDAQDSQHLTSDERFDYIPQELHSFHVEEVTGE